MSNTHIEDLPGADAVIAWFGHLPRFHDARLFSHALAPGAAGFLKIHAWRMTERTDAQGYFITDRHAVVTFSFERITALSVEDAETEGIIGALRIEPVTGTPGHRLLWDSSWGIWGEVTGHGLSLNLIPGEPKTG